MESRREEDGGRRGKPSKGKGEGRKGEGEKMKDKASTIDSFKWRIDRYMDDEGR